jgi:hypothetical protein
VTKASLFVITQRAISANRSVGTNYANALFGLNLKTHLDFILAGKKPISLKIT